MATLCWIEPYLLETGIETPPIQVGATGRRVNRYADDVTFDSHLLLECDEITSPSVKQHLHRPGERVDYVYFPGDGFLVPTRADRSPEVIPVAVAAFDAFQLVERFFVAFSSVLAVSRCFCAIG